MYVIRIEIVISIVILRFGKGSRHTLKRVPEMMDTPPIQNDYAFIISCKKVDSIRQITRLPEKVSPPDRGGES